MQSSNIYLVFGPVNYSNPAPTSVFIDLRGFSATMSLTLKQNQAIEITERISSGLSICGALFVILTYSVSASFHKPVNRMVFYASWGNILANVSTMISLSGITAGKDSVTCQSQAFLIQM